MNVSCVWSAGGCSTEHELCPHLPNGSSLTLPHPPHPLPNWQRFAFPKFSNWVRINHSQNYTPTTIISIPVIEGGWINWEFRFTPFTTIYKKGGFSSLVLSWSHFDNAPKTNRKGRKGSLVSPWFNSFFFWYFNKTGKTRRQDPRRAWFVPAWILLVQLEAASPSRHALRTRRKIATPSFPTAQGESDRWGHTWHKGQKCSRQIGITPSFLLTKVVKCETEFES